MLAVIAKWLRDRREAASLRNDDAGSASELGLCPDTALRRAAAAAPRALAWSRAAVPDPEEWQAAARDKLVELTGYGRFGGPPGIVHRRDFGVRDGLRHHRLYVRVRHGHDIPVRIVWDPAALPDSDCRAVMCLQDEGVGMHVSWGEAGSEDETRAVSLGCDLARQAARRGQLGVCVELAGAGERLPRAPAAGEMPVPSILATNALALGRCLLGDRASDISSVLNWMIDGEFGFDLDVDNVTVMGHGAGGCAGLLAAALDPRIAGVAVLDGLGLVRETIAIRTLDLAYVVPGLLRWMDMDDVVALCAPRPVLVLSRRDHPAWPVAEAAEAVRTAGAAYAALMAPDALASSVVETLDESVEPALWRLFPALLAAAEAARDAATVTGQDPAGAATGRI